MGEIADATINGDFCDQCGEWLGVGDGYPRRCDDCAKDNCSICQRSGMKPSHNGSKNCESGSIASGGNKSHCSCDVCF